MSGWVKGKLDNRMSDTQYLRRGMYRLVSACSHEKLLNAIVNKIIQDKYLMHQTVFLPYVFLIH